LDRLLKNEEFICEVGRSFFSLNYAHLVEPPKSRSSPTDRAKIDQVTESKRQELRAAVLDMLIDGKKLRDMTGRECIEHGGWIMRIGKAIKPNQRVGEALTEKQVRQLRSS
jgi:hypothetical protein